jgi:cell division protein FtsW
LAKFAVVVMLSAWTANVGRKASTLMDGLVKPGAMLAMMVGLIFLEPDFGTTILVAAVGGAILFAAGAPWPYLAGGGAAGLAGFAVAILHDEVRRGRILAFLMPDKYPAAAYQLGQSMQAFTLGGFWGVGLGQSMQKQYFLPEAHTDFILAIIGEELGLVVTCLVIALFAGFLICGMVISLQAPDLFGRLLGTGFTLMTSIQAAINVGVVTGCLPTKGLPLPFISYGGSSLLMSMIGVGVLVNIARQGVADAVHLKQAVRDKAQWL